MQDKTLIIIAHRLSTIKRADQILVIDDGVIAHGAHMRSFWPGKGNIRSYGSAASRQKAGESAQKRNTLKIIETTRLNTDGMEKVL